MKARKSGRSLMGAVFFFSVFVNLLMLTGPLFMLQVYDRVLGSRSEETLVALFLLVAVMFGFMGVLDYARGRVLARYGAQFQGSLDAPVFRATMAQAIDPKKRAKAAMGLRDLDVLQQFFTSPVVLALCDIPWTPLFMVLIFVFHPWLGWLALSGALILVILSLINHFWSRDLTARAQLGVVEASSFANEARTHAELISAQGFGKSMLSRWQHMRRVGVDAVLGAADVTGTSASATKAFRLFLQSAMLALGAYLVLLGQMTPGAMIAGSILMGRALAPIEQSIGSWTLVQSASQSWTSLGQLLVSQTQPEPSVALPRPDALLVLRNISYQVPDRKAPVLKAINLKITPGEAIGVIGKSGAGKSSLARMMLGLTAPSTGEVMFGGAHFSQYDRDALGAYIGYLPQHVTLFPATIAENIARMSETPDQEAVIRAAKRADVHDLITNLPEGYDTSLGKHDSALSGGQMQRIALARALYPDPVMLILDEPNSALDADGTDALNRVVREFKAAGRAIVLMTHRPMSITECDRLVVIEEGVIRADGPRDEVLQSMLKNADQIRQIVSGARS
ncbi:MAG: type I secretion system permease/ATPase [Pseudomonadota bacterium]